MPSQNDIRQQITQSIIESLEKGGVPPWRRPWRVGKNTGAHANALSKRSYRGLNPLLLDLASEKYGFTSRWWGTFKQWQSLGGRVTPRPEHVPPGKWGTQICFWSPVTKTTKAEDGTGEEDRFFVLRLYTVFNADQVEGLAHLRADKTDTTEPGITDYQPAEEALEAARIGMGIQIRYGGDSAFYHSVSDYIQMPRRETFESQGEFYGTAFHEMVHATEHRSRLDWSRRKRDNSYALGELIAELGGVFVCRELGVVSEDLTNHTAYLKNWLQGMKGDSRYIISAAAQASKAASYILGFSRTADEVPEEESELATV